MYNHGDAEVHFLRHAQTEELDDLIMIVGIVSFEKTWLSIPTSNVVVLSLVQILVHIDSLKR